MYRPSIIIGCRGSICQRRNKDLKFSDNRLARPHLPMQKADVGRNFQWFLGPDSLRDGLHLLQLAANKTGRTFRRVDHAARKGRTFGKVGPLGPLGAWKPFPTHDQTGAKGARAHAGQEAMHSRDDPIPLFCDQASRYSLSLETMLPLSLEIACL